MRNLLQGLKVGNTSKFDCRPLCVAAAPCRGSAPYAQ
jgi:hypothetical protein